MNPQGIPNQQYIVDPNNPNIVYITAPQVPYTTSGSVQQPMIVTQQPMEVNQSQQLQPPQTQPQLSPHQSTHVGLIDENAKTEQIQIQIQLIILLHLVFNNF